MFRVNVFEVKAKLSEYLDRAASGERIVICRHNKPVAELRAVEDVRAEPRPVGALPGRPQFDVPSSFFDPLPDEDLDLWDGGATRPRLHGGRSHAALRPAPAALIQEAAVVRLLLDTCTFLWLAGGGRALSPAAAQAVRDPSNEVFLSAVSSWEIIVKHGMGLKAACELIPNSESPQALLTVRAATLRHRRRTRPLAVGTGPLPSMCHGSV